jgi:hypothetical protein
MHFNHDYTKLSLVITGAKWTELASKFQLKELHVTLSVIARWRKEVHWIFTEAHYQTRKHNSIVKFKVSDLYFWSHCTFEPVLT